MRKLYRPYLEMNLNLGFMGWETAIMRESYSMNAIEYIMLRWYFFKWNGKFRLYQIHERN